MMQTIEFLVFLLLLIGGILVYRKLVNSVWFTKFINGISPPAESDEEVIDSLESAESKARRYVDDGQKDVAEKARALRQVKNRLKP